MCIQEVQILAVGCLFFGSRVLAPFAQRFWVEILGVPSALAVGLAIEVILFISTPVAINEAWATPS